MSFNQKSGKIQQRRSSFKRDKKQLYRKPVVVHEQKINQNSQRDTNIQSIAHDDSSTKEESRFMLPTIKIQSVGKIGNIPLLKLNSRYKFFTQEDKQEEQQNLFIVKQNEKKSIRMLKKNIVAPLYEKLKKKQQSIVLNYLNGKIDSKRPKKKKRKLKKATSQQRIVQRQQSMLLPSSQADRYKRHFSQFKKHKTNKFKLQERMDQRQSLPNNSYRQCSMLSHKLSTAEKQDKIIRELKNKIEHMESCQKEERQCKKLPFTQNFKLSHHFSPNPVVLSRKFTLHQSTERQKDKFSQSQLSQTQRVSQSFDNRRQKQSRMENIDLIIKDKEKIEQIQLVQPKEQRSPYVERCNSQSSVSIIHKGQLKNMSEHKMSKAGSRCEQSDRSMQSRVSVESNRLNYHTQINEEDKQQVQDSTNLKIWTERQDINLNKQLSRTQLLSQRLKSSLKIVAKNQQDEQITDNNLKSVQNQSPIITKRQKLSSRLKSQADIYLNQQKNDIYSKNQPNKSSVVSQKQNLNIDTFKQCSLNETKQQVTKINSVMSQRQQSCLNNQDKLSLNMQENNQFPPRIPDKSFLKLKTYYADVDKKIYNEKSLSPTKIIKAKFELKQLPSQKHLLQFIQTYECENLKINIPSLIKQDNFKILLEQNKQIYFGLIESNKKQGEGVTIRQNYLFEGIYKDGQKLEGIQINQAGKYIGEFRNNKKQGKGEFIWKNGQHYNGQWLNGKKHGNGIWSSPNGDIYIGQWVEGKVQGQGIHQSLNGHHYEGSFKQYLKSGSGKETLPNGDLYEGQFQLGKPHGRGNYTWKNGQSYEGSFFNGIRHGAGVLQDQRQNIYKGHFNNEQAHGQCEINFNSHDSYKGTISNGMFRERGVLKLFQQKQSWDGHWLDDKFVEAVNLVND